MRFYYSTANVQRTFITFIYYEIDEEYVEKKIAYPLSTVAY